MYGYVIPDKPNMFVKDFALYRAFYCGLCKSIGKMYGQLMRFSTNYDVTFLNVLAHAVFDREAEISNEVCILNPFKNKSVVRHDELTAQIVYINTILAHYKCVDDAEDGGGAAKKWADRAVIRRKYRQARKLLPDVDAAVAASYDKLRGLEKANCAVCEQAAEPFAEMMKEIARCLFAGAYTDDLGEMMYRLGKWIYLADAVDDIDEDFRRKNYNVFLVGYEYKDKATFLAERGKEAEALLMGCYDAMCASFDRLSLKRYEGVITNILWYGILESTKELLRSTTKCKKTRI